MLAETIPNWVAGNIDAKDQDHARATCTKIIKKEDGLVDIKNDDPEMLYRKFRAYKLWPNIFFLSKNKRVKITDAEFVNGEFRIKKVIPEGRKEITYKNFLKYI